MWYCWGYFYHIVARLGCFLRHKQGFLAIVYYTELGFDAVRYELPVLQFRELVLNHHRQVNDKANNQANYCQDNDGKYVTVSSLIYFH